MDSGDFVDLKEACPQCGDRRAIVRDGFLYCMECGMRAAESQPILEFTREDIGFGSRISRQKITLKPNKENYENMWTTWHAHNMILVGLVEEICSCGAKEHGLGQTVLMLWVKWLQRNRVAFYSRTKISMPKLTFGFRARDLEYLYGFKYTKSRKRALPIVKTSAHSMALVQHEYNKFKASQTTNTNMESQNLEDLEATVVKKPESLQFNKVIKKYLKETMTPEDLASHIASGMCGVRCKCFRKKRYRLNDRVTNLSIFNLYAILFLGLRLNNDDIHLGDLLRWCREGHLSYHSYKHFFPSDMLLKTGDRLSWNANSMSHNMLRQTAGTFARVLRIKSMRPANLNNLIKRYIEELQLPTQLLNVIMKLKATVPKLGDYNPKVSKFIPNYEAMAMSYIIVAMKIIFGLDGVIENKISSSVEQINSILSLKKTSKYLDDEIADSYKSISNRIFVWRDWVQYIEYRKICISQCHYPTLLRLHPNNVDNPELFLHHKKTTNKSVHQENVTFRPDFLVIRSVMEDIQTDYNAFKNEFPTFGCSTCPMLSYTKTLFTWRSPFSDLQICQDLLNEDFPSYNIVSLLNPKRLKSQLARLNCVLTTERCMCNSDITVDFGLKKSFKQLSKRIVSCDSHTKVKVRDCTSEKWTNKLKIEEIIDFLTKDTLKPKNRVTVKFGKLKPKNIYGKGSKSAKSGKVSITLNLCYQNYWLRHYPSLVHFRKKSFEEELDESFPPSFVWLLRECAATTEMTSLDLYKELCDIEKSLLPNKASPPVVNVSKPAATQDE